MERMTAKSSLSDFEVVKKIGEGAFSSVYKVIRKSDQLMYALKKVKIAQLKNREKENALNEIRILASIDHPNIVGYKEAFIDDREDTLCIIMEFLAGGDLYNKITECKKQRALIPERLIWRYLIQMVRGLKLLHSMKIVHRDLKSANLFLSEDLKHIKLGDLNVSKVVKNRLVYTQTGTPYYASPEVWRDEPYDTKSDIWSLGCVVYEMCNRAPPFNARKMEELYQKVQKGSFDRVASVYTDELQNMVASFLRVSPILRPSCDEILDNHFVKMRLREMEDDLNLGADQALLLNTIKLTPILKDLNNVLPEAKYDTDKKRSGSARPDKKEPRESISTAAEKIEPGIPRPSASRGSYSRCQVPTSPKEMILNQPGIGPLGMPLPITGYSSPRNQANDSREIRKSGRQAESRHVEVRQSAGDQADILADRLQHMKEMIKSYEKQVRSPSASQRQQVNLSRERQQPTSGSESRLINGGYGSRAGSVNNSVDVTGRRKESYEYIAPQGSYNRGNPYYKPPQALKVECDDHVARRLSHEKSSQLRHNGVPISPSVRESSNSVRARLLSGNSPGPQRRSEAPASYVNIRRESNSRSRVKTSSQQEEELSRRMEEEIVKKHNRRMQQLAEQQQAPMPLPIDLQAQKGITLKKHPKVMGPFLISDKEASKQNKIETVKRSSKHEASEHQHPSNNIRGSANAINEELRRVKKSYDLRARSREVDHHINTSGQKENPSSGRAGSRVSSGNPLPKGSSESRLKSGGGSTRTPQHQYDLINVHNMAGVDSLGVRKPSASNRQLKDHQIEELDRINRRLDMMNKQILMEKNVPSTGPGLLGMRRKQVVQEDAYLRANQYQN
jgi:serine/threonine protein kinase